MPIIDFSSCSQPLNEAQLRENQAALLAQLAALDAREPENMDCAAYEDWADEHEELEDLLDEIQDLLDAL